MLGDLDTGGFVSGFPTQRDFLPRVSGQDKDEQSHGGEQHTGDEEVQGVVEGPPADGHHEGHGRVRLLAAVVKDLVPGSRNPWEEKRKWPFLLSRVFLQTKLRLHSPMRSHSPLGM